MFNADILNKEDIDYLTVLFKIVLIWFSNTGSIFQSRREENTYVTIQSEYYLIRFGKDLVLKTYKRDMKKELFFGYTYRQGIHYLINDKF